MLTEYGIASLSPRRSGFPFRLLIRCPPLPLHLYPFKLMDPPSLPPAGALSLAGGALVRWPQGGVQEARLLLARGPFFEPSIPPLCDFLSCSFSRGRVGTADTPLLLSSLTAGLVLRQRGGEAAGLGCFELAAAITERLEPASDLAERLLVGVSSCLRRLGPPREKEAFAATVRALEWVLEHAPEDRKLTCILTSALVRQLLRQGRRKEAPPLLARLLARCERSRGPLHFDACYARYCLASVLGSLGKCAEALPLMEETVAAIGNASTELGAAVGGPSLSQWHP